MHTAYAWYVHMGGGRVFYSAKRQFGLVWPVRGERSRVIHPTGQTRCYDMDGIEMGCRDAGPFVQTSKGHSFPDSRFRAEAGGILDRLTGLCWYPDGDISHAKTDWAGALETVQQLNGHSRNSWRLPNINELESLVDLSCHSPALPDNHPFINVQEEYWSATTSMFEPQWAWCLYMDKGAVGVGWKPGKEFHVWPVCTA